MPLCARSRQLQRRFARRSRTLPVRLYDGREVAGAPRGAREQKSGAARDGSRIVVKDSDKHWARVALDRMLEIQ